MFLRVLLAAVLERAAKPVLHMVIAPGSTGTTPPGGGDLLQPRGHIDAIAEYVVAVDDNVALVHADAKDDADDPPGSASFRSAMAALQFHGAVHGVDHAGELRPAGRLRLS